MLRRNLRWLSVALLLGATGALAADLRVEKARVRLLPGDLPAAGYFRLENTGEQPVVLTGARSAAFASATLHESRIRDGQASMVPVSRLALGAGERLEFAPGGYHLMLMRRQRALDVGDTLEVTLEFGDGQSLPVEFEAVSPAAP